MDTDEKKDFEPDIKTKDNETSINDINSDEIDINEVEEHDVKTLDTAIEDSNTENMLSGSKSEDSNILNSNMYQLSSSEPSYSEPFEINSEADTELDVKPKPSSESIGKKIAKSVVAAPVSIAANTVKSTAKSILGKANPLDKKINKADISDTGTESLRLAFGSIKKSANTIKTVNNTIKTVENSIKTTHTVVKTGKAIIIKTSDYGKKAVITAYKATKFIATHVIAAVMNPFAAIMLAFLLLVATSIGSVIMLVASLGGSAGANATAMTTAAGLGEDKETIAEKYEEGRAFFDKAIEVKRSGYNAIIDSLRFSDSDWEHNDLIYLELYVGETGPYVWKSAWDRWNRGAYADPEWKNILKRDVWRLGITYNEAAAIAYVYLEKEAGEEFSDETDSIYDASIHEVEYTQEVFDEIVNHCIEYSDSVMNNQVCPPENCVNEDGRRYCKHEHTLHNVGVWVYDKEHVMDALGFSETEKRWVELTEYGFEHNIHITGDDTSSEEVSE